MNKFQLLNVIHRMITSALSMTDSHSESHNRRIFQKLLDVLTENGIKG